MIVPMLQRIHADLASIKAKLEDTSASLDAKIDHTSASLDAKIDRIGAKLDETNARLEAQTALFEARFIGLEHAVLDVSSRVFYGTKQYQSTSTRHDRELDEVRARLTRIEQRLDEPKL
jgi:chromosome segregation ATPase